MKWFKKNTPLENRIADMTPLEQVTDLLVCLQLADNRIDYSEKEAWNATLKRLFPDYNLGHAENAMQRSFTAIENLDDHQRINRIHEIITSLIQLYSVDKVKKEILPELVNLVEADGIVMSTELDMLKTIEEIIARTVNYR
ncbi:MAG: hypothetical protein H8E14_15450 [Candidatus Marinimicrobia bacterium]|nr:hypothetical protein [Candidatus Neomarinimicrobiota bacterium]